MTELIDQVKRYIEQVVPTIRSSEVLYEDKERPETLFRLERMNENDGYFNDLIRSERFMSLAQTMLDDTALPQQAELFAKAPRIGKVTPPHQDGYYFMLEPNHALTCWLALDRADEENGCIRYVRGSHRRGMRPHASSDVFGFSQGITDFGSHDEALEQTACVEPGDLIIHHCLTIHRADANPSPHQRRAIGLVYHAQHAKPDRQAQQAYRKQLFQKWEQAERL